MSKVNPFIPSMPLVQQAKALKIFKASVLAKRFTLVNGWKFKVRGGLAYIDATRFKVYCEPCLWNEGIEYRMGHITLGAAGRGATWTEAVKLFEAHVNDPLTAMYSITADQQAMNERKP